MGFNIAKRLGGDPALMSEGVWVDEADGLRLLIARWNNKAYRKTLHKSVSEPKSKFDKRAKFKIDKALQEAMVNVANTVLLGWEGMDETDDNDKVIKDIPYSPEKALEYFEKYPEFFDVVCEYAQDISLFKKKKDEEAAGN